MATVVKIPKWSWGFEFLEGRVTIEGDGPLHAVYLDGAHVGHVEKSTRTWERRIKGERYVAARGQTPCWRIVSTPGERYSRLSHDTRSRAALTLASLHAGQP